MVRAYAFTIFVAAATAAACSGGAEYHPTYSSEQPGAAVPAADTARFALVARNAWLYMAASENAEHARVNSQPSDPGSPVVYRVVRELPGGWTKIETVDTQTDRTHCEGGNYALRDLRLRMFVHTADLALTTTREVTTRFADGTAITLASGVPMVPTGRTTPQGQSIYTAHAGYMFNTWVDAAAIGHRYDPTRHFELADASEYVAQNARLVFGQTGELRTRSNLLAAPRFVYARRDVPNGVLVTLRTNCGQFDVVVDAAAIAHARGGDLLMGGLGASEAQSPHAREGARIYWANGHAAGSVRRDTRFHSEIASTEGRRCFRKSLRWASRAAEDEQFLRLCFDPGDIVEVGSGDAGVSDGSANEDAS